MIKLLHLTYLEHLLLLPQYSKCNIPCPYGDCDSVLAYHINKGKYGEVSLDGLNVLALDNFKGNVWARETKITLAFFFDERANPEQRLCSVLLKLFLWQ
jgi:hypothetical protein